MTAIDIDEATSETEVVSTDGDPAIESELEWIDAALGWDELLVV